MLARILLAAALAVPAGAAWADSATVTNDTGLVARTECSTGTSPNAVWVPCLPLGVAPLQIQPAPGIWTDRSGTVTTGGTSQQLTAANTSRKSWWIANPPTATEALFVNFGDAASTTASGSVMIIPGGSYSDPSGFVTTQQINVTAATAGHAYTSKEGQ